MGPTRCPGAPAPAPPSRAPCRTLHLQGSEPPHPGQRRGHQVDRVPAWEKLKEEKTRYICADSPGGPHPEGLLCALWTRVRLHPLSHAHRWGCWRWGRLWPLGIPLGILASGITEDWKRLTEILLCFTATTAREERIYIVGSFGRSREVRNHKIDNTIKPHWIQPPFLFKNKQTNKAALGCTEVHSATHPLEVRRETPITPIPHPELPPESKWIFQEFVSQFITHFVFKAEHIKVEIKGAAWYPIWGQESRQKKHCLGSVVVLLMFILSVRFFFNPLHRL